VLVVFRDGKFGSIKGQIRQKRFGVVVNGRRPTPCVLLFRGGESGLGVTRVVTISSFRQKTFSATLTAPCEGGASAFGSHAGTKTVLTFASSF
jgi:hypothetical protein